MMWPLRPSSFRGPAAALAIVGSPPADPLLWGAEGHTRSCHAQPGLHNTGPLMCRQGFSVMSDTVHVGCEKPYKATLCSALLPALSSEQTLTDGTPINMVDRQYCRWCVMLEHVVCKTEDEGLTWGVQLIEEYGSPCGLGIRLVGPPAARHAYFRAGSALRPTLCSPERDRAHS